MKKLFFLFFLLTVFAGCMAGEPNGGGIPTTTFQGSEFQGEMMTNSQEQSNGEYAKILQQGEAKACLELTDSGAVYTCFDKYFTDKASSVGPEAAFKDLKALYGVDANVRSYCHPFAHAIGHGAVTKYPVLSEAFLHGDNFCWSGYFHGVMEDYVQKIGRENLPSKMDGICAEIPGKETYSFDYYNCVHGIGHGVMAITQDQLFDSLKLCDSLTGWWEQNSCYGGVFMENIIADGLNHKTGFLRPEEPLYPCSAVEKPYKEACYLMQTSYMLKVTSYDFKKVFGLCEGSDEGFQVTCYRSLGRDASGSSISNVDKTRDTCNLGKNYEQKSECMVGAVKDFVSYFHSDIQGKELCNSTDDQKMKELCLQTVDEYYKQF